MEGAGANFSRRCASGPGGGLGTCRKGGEGQGDRGYETRAEAGGLAKSSKKATNLHPVELRGIFLPGNSAGRDELSMLQRGKQGRHRTQGWMGQAGAAPRPALLAYLEVS